MAERGQGERGLDERDLAGYSQHFGEIFKGNFAEK
jgi:hypothetical protein